MSDDVETTELEPVLEELREANRWLRLLATPLLRDRLTEVLVSDNDRKIYQASTGGSQTEVATASGVSQPTVSAAWKKWAAVGIVQRTKTEGRFTRLVDLESFGISVDAG
jgi:CRP-like cAMP-binding protein